MRNSLDLFKLVKSLSKSEKRYFKLFSSLQGGEKNYMRLFNAIDLQEEYNEALLKEMFAGERFVKQFNVAKKYLYDLILKSLLVYHSESTVNGKIKEMIRSVEVLFERGLEKQAKKILVRAIELARKHEEFGLLLEALSWQRRMESPDIKTQEQVENIYGPMMNVANSLCNVLEHEHQYYRIRVATGGAILADQEQLRSLTRLADDPLLQDEKTAGSVRARLLYHWTKVHYYSAQGIQMQSKALEHTQAQIDLMDANPDLFAEHPHLYVSLLSNRIMLSRLGGRFDEFFNYLADIQNIVPAMLTDKRIRHPRVRASLFISFCSQQVGMLSAFGQFNRVLEMREFIESSYEEHKEFLRPEQTSPIEYYTSIAYYATGDLRRALEYNSKIVEWGDNQQRPNLLLYSRLDALMLHYELGHLDYLEYLVRSVRRYLNSLDLSAKHPQLILDLFARLPYMSSAGEKRRECARFEKCLAELENDPMEVDMFRYFNYSAWLRSRVEGRTWAEAIKDDIQRACRKIAPRPTVLTNSSDPTDYHPSSLAFQQQNTSSMRAT